MQLSPDEFMKLQGSISDKDIELAMLRKEVEHLRCQAIAEGNAQTDSKFITLPMENVCRVLRDLKGSPNLVSFLFLALQKMMPADGVSAGAVQRMLAAASLESTPLGISAQGDIRVEGNYNHLHDNDNVNL